MKYLVQPVFMVQNCLLRKLKKISDSKSQRKLVLIQI